MHVRVRFHRPRGPLRAAGARPRAAPHRPHPQSPPGGQRSRGTSTTARAGAGLAAWESADILPWPAFVERLWDEAMHAPRPGSSRSCSRRTEEAALWESIVADVAPRAGALLGRRPPPALPRAPGSSPTAWRLRAAGAGRQRGREGLRGVVLDATSGGRARARFDRRRAPARRGAAPSASRGGLPAPRRSSSTPSTCSRRRCATCSRPRRGPASTCSPASRRGTPASPSAFPSPRRPRRSRPPPAGRARGWRPRDRGRTPRIGVVVPDLAQPPRSSGASSPRRCIGSNAPGGRRARASTFRSASRWRTSPSRDFALALLSLAGRQIAFERASRLLRSPFLGESRPRWRPRARLDAQLRKRAPPWRDPRPARGPSRRSAEAGTPRAAMPRLAGEAARLAAQRPRRGRARRRPGRARSGTAARPGFPASEASTPRSSRRSPSGTRRSRARVARRRRGNARPPRPRWRHLRHSCGHALPARVARGPGPGHGHPGDRSGLEFDALWVIGLDDDAWPQPPRPNPFLPVSLQRAAGVPQASAEASLFDLDRRITSVGRRGGRGRLLPCRRAERGALARASPLVAGFAAAEAADARRSRVPEACARRYSPPGATGRRAGCADERGPALAPARHAEAPRSSRDQAACPFRAFARHRLGADAPEVPQPGLGPPTAGSSCTRCSRPRGAASAPRARWTAWRRSARGLVAGAAASALGGCAARRPGRARGPLRRARAGAPRRERPRLAGVRTRPRALRGRRAGRAARDRRSAASRATCRSTAWTGSPPADSRSSTTRPASRAWRAGSGERPDEPQLPMYALASGDDVAAVAFARLKPGDTAFTGLAREEGPAAGHDDRLEAPHAGSAAPRGTELLDAWRQCDWTPSGASSRPATRGSIPSGRSPPARAATCAARSAACTSAGEVAADEADDGEGDAE